MKQILILAFCLLLPVSVQGGDGWQMEAEGSRLIFTASIMGNPSEGEFTSFTGAINFDPENLGQSRVDILIDMSQIEADYNDVKTNLTKPEWFDVRQYPNARFVSRLFKHMGAKDYQVTGELTLRNITRRETLAFTLTRYDRERAAIKGQMMINRLDYGIGQGDWQDSSIVANEIFLDILLAAQPMN